MIRDTSGRVWEPIAGTGIMRLASTTSAASALCPDLLRYEHIGAADNWRGRVVRAFFWLMRAWPA